MSTAAPTGFRERLQAMDAPMFGTFIKTPGPQSVEIVGGLGFDFVVIDAEHAPFDRGRTEIALLAARASGVAAVVRVPSAQPDVLLGALDDGADAVLVPHMLSAAHVRDVVAACRYAGARGFSNGCRAGGYGARAQWSHIDAADREVAVIGMIEDPQAVQSIDDILSVDGLDGIFVGRADLSVAMGDRAVGAPQVREATLRVLSAARAAAKPVSLLVASAEEAREFRALGASAFVIASDQGFMRHAAQDALGRHRAALA